jgi:rhodanese-related sulfurtransferase
MDYKCRERVLLRVLVGIGIAASWVADPNIAESKQVTQRPGTAQAVERITVEELKAKFARNEPVTVIDVRASQQFADSDQKIKGALRFKVRRLRSRIKFAPLKDLPRNSEIVTYCACSGDESAVSAARILIDNGFTRVRALKGGWNEWLKAGGPTEGRRKS